MLGAAAAGAADVVFATPFTTADDVGVGSGPFGPVLPLRAPTGLAGGIEFDILYSRPFAGVKPHDCSCVVIDSFQSDFNAS